MFAASGSALYGWFCLSYSCEHSGHFPVNYSSVNLSQGHLETIQGMFENGTPASQIATHLHKFSSLNISTEQVII